MTRPRFHLPLVCACALAAASGCQEYAIQEVVYTDVFNQGDAAAGVDFLWVLDNSGTMSGEQERLNRSLDGIMSLFEESVADFRLGLITTDVEDEEHSGRLQGDPPILGPDSPDLAETFIATSLVGTSGSRDEEGFGALALAMTDALDEGYNEGFFRHEVALEVVVVSDEDDQGEGEVADMLAAFDQLVPNPDHFRIHAIVGDEPYGCLAPDASAEAGLKYLEAARETGGHTGSICLDDWTTLLEDIGLAALGLLNSFVLSAEPERDSLEVRVDDVLIPERDVDGWQYDPAENAIVFDRFAIPRPGMEVVVSYHRRQES